MSFRSLLSLACLMMLTSSALAGGWDTGPFDNDDALDWVWALTESNNLSVIDAALDGVLESRDYIEAPTASMAIAAAEVLAALAGNPADALPEEVTAWVDANELDVNTDMAAKARKVIKLVMDDERSELAQLWGDAPPLASAWRAGLEDLAQRLQ
ncbi:MAG: DUF4259 domain-containing protein [Woeseiaceae bacterium]|nr:DUF4259 domain-containing protein [Woeseiaceae bacterium]